MAVWNRMAGDEADNGGGLQTELAVYLITDPLTFGTMDQMQLIIFLPIIGITIGLVALYWSWQHGYSRQAIALVVAIIGSWFLQWAWNGTLVAAIPALHPITFWDAVKMLLLGTLFIGVGTATVLLVIRLATLQRPQ